MLHFLLLSLLAMPTRASDPRASDPRASDPRADAVLDTAIARMGGAGALRRIERVRFELMTQWQRTSFDERPYTDAPSYELHSDLRDYAAGAWRNTRRFASPGTGAWRAMTDIVRDTIAARRFSTGAAVLPGSAAPADGWSPWAPLNVAYVDERRELFAFAPERALLSARDALDRRSLGDTTIGGVAHARVAATIDRRYPATLFIRHGDGFLAMVRFHAAQANDFGLTPWGDMEVELWYSRWQRASVAGGASIAYPMQWDVRRIARPYKRVSVLAANFDAVASADSFAVSDSLARAFLATARRPMHDVPLDSARLIDGRLADFRSFGAPAGAVKLGRRWVLIETGQGALNAERATAWLAHADPGAVVAAALVTTGAGNGGVASLAEHDVPMYVAPTARPFVAVMLRNQHRAATSVHPVDRARWLVIDGDSLRVEPIDLPDAPGALVIYAPSLRWVYAASAVSPLHLELVMAHARARGWTVERVGSVRGFALPAPRMSAARAP